MRKNNAEYQFREARRRYNAISEKILLLELDNVDSEVIDRFSSDFLPNGTFFTKTEDRKNWEENFFNDKEKAEKYQSRLKEIAQKYDFKAVVEKDTLEEFLLTGEIISFRHIPIPEKDKHRIIMERDDFGRIVYFENRGAY